VNILNRGWIPFITTCISLVLVIASLLFWFIAPRYFPLQTGERTPFLAHAVECAVYLTQEYYTNKGGVFIYTNVPDNYFDRFINKYKNDFYARLAACDSFNDERRTAVIIEQLDKNYYKPGVKKLLLAYEERGNKRAREILNQRSMPADQGISPGEVMKAANPTR
jgi:hypothetical protein